MSECLNGKMMYPATRQVHDTTAFQKWVIHSYIPVATREGEALGSRVVSLVTLTVGTGVGATVGTGVSGISVALKSKSVLSSAMTTPLVNTKAATTRTKANNDLRCTVGRLMM